MSSQKKSVQVFRELLSVLRTLTNNTSNSNQVSAYKHTYGYCYVAFLYRSSKNVCNKNATNKDIQFLAETYLCLLKSLRDAKILFKRYNGGGEQSVEEIADKIGFKLPELPVAK